MGDLYQEYYHPTEGRSNKIMEYVLKTSQLVSIRQNHKDFQEESWS